MRNLLYKAHSNTLEVSDPAATFTRPNSPAQAYTTATLERIGMVGEFRESDFTGSSDLPPDDYAAIWDDVSVLGISWPFSVLKTGFVYIVLPLQSELVRFR